MTISSKAKKGARLSPRQESFTLGLLKGQTQRQAFREAYPASVSWADTAVDTRASKLFCSELVQQRYHALLNEAKNEAIWLREQSICALKDLLHIAMKELDRLHTAYFEGLNEIEILMNQAKDERERRELRKKWYAKRHKTWLSPVAVSAIQSAIERLNRMQGYYPSNPLITANITFIGEVTDDN